MSNVEFIVINCCAVCHDKSMLTYVGIDILVKRFVDSDSYNGFGAGNIDGIFFSITRSDTFMGLLSSKKHIMVHA